MKRKREHFIIDGYNVIHSWPELIALMGELGEARDRLIHLLAEYGAYEDYDMTIVFDALFTADDEHTEKRSQRLTIVYTGAGETADSYIERLAYQSVRSGREVHVVTSDSAEQSVILGAGAYRLPSLELRRRVHKVKERLQKDYLRKPVFPLLRNDVAARLDQATAARLDKMRKKHD